MKKKLLPVKGDFGSESYFDRPDDEVDEDEYARGYNAAILDEIPDDGRFWTGCSVAFIQGANDAGYKDPDDDNEFSFDDEGR